MFIFSSSRLKRWAHRVQSSTVPNTLSKPLLCHLKRLLRIIWCSVLNIITLRFMFMLFFIHTEKGNKKWHLCVCFCFFNFPLIICLPLSQQLEIPYPEVAKHNERAYTFIHSESSGMASSGTDVYCVEVFFSFKQTLLCNMYFCPTNRMYWSNLRKES